MFKIVCKKPRIVLDVENNIKMSSNDGRYKKWLLEGNTPEGMDNDYTEKRIAEYPSIEEQLDMQYHDFDAWKSLIDNVKAKYPVSDDLLPLPAWVEEERELLLNPVEVDPLGVV